MKIIKRVDKKTNKKTYYRYSINLPKKVEESGLLNKELTIRIIKGRITIREI